jgi:CRP-like cAMP-binding protein
MSATEADLDYRIRILKNASLFARATDEDIAELARLGKVVAVERGRVLAKPGQEGSHIYVVHSGLGAELHFELGEQKPILVKLHGKGSAVGLVCAVIRDARREDPSGGPGPSRRAEALTNLTVLSLPAADFFRRCRRNSDLGAALARTLAEQCDLIARIYARSTQNTLEMRLAGFFTRVKELSAVDDWNPVTNVGKLSQSAIATMLGVSREHVNRTIAMWERSGLIFQNKNGDFIIQNANRLAQLALTPAERGAPEEEDDWL